MTSAAACTQRRFQITFPPQIAFSSAAASAHQRRSGSFSVTETTPHSLLSPCIDRKAGRLGTLLEKQLTELTSRASIYWGPANHTQSPWLSALLALGHMHQMHVILNIFICDTKYIYL